MKILSLFSKLIWFEVKQRKKKTIAFLSSQSYWGWERPGENKCVAVLKKKASTRMTNESYEIAKACTSQSRILFSTLMQMKCLNY